MNEPCDHEFELIEPPFSVWAADYFQPYWRCKLCGESGYLIPADA